MKYIEPEMDVVLFEKVNTIVESDGFNNGGGGSSGTDTDIDVFG